MNNKKKITEIILDDDKAHLVFLDGLYGFEDSTDFVLSDSECEPFLRLQSKQEESLSFLVVDPFLFFPDYEIDVDDKTLAILGVTNAEDVYVLVIVTISRTKPPSITANLLGPIVINKKNNKAKQVVLDNPQWRTKHDLLTANSNGGNPLC